MSVYAVGRTTLKNGIPCIVAYNTVTESLMEIQESGIWYYVNTTRKINNLEVDDQRRIKWVNGSSSRYTHINKKTGEITNPDSVVVIAIYSTRNKKLYGVCNYQGKTMVVSTRELIAYGKKHMIANCKIVKRGNKEFIATIGGSGDKLENIDRLNADPIYELSPGDKKLTIHMQCVLSNEFTLPSSNLGIPLTDIESIEIKPPILREKIKKFTLNREITKISGKLFPFPNLQAVNIPGNNLYIGEFAFRDLKNLEVINCGTIANLGERACKDLYKLRQFNSTGPITSISESAFSNCPQLDTTNILVEGVCSVERDAFSRNMVNTIITLPRTLTKICSTSFDSNPNLSRVIVKSNSLQVFDHWRSISSAVFRADHKVIMEVGPYFMLDIIKGRLAQNVEIQVREKDEQDLQFEKRLRKCNMIGVQLDPMKIHVEPSAISEIIDISSHEEVKEMVKTIIKLEIGTSGYTPPTLHTSLSGFTVDIAIQAFPDIVYLQEVKEIQGIKDIGKYFMVVSRRIKFYPYDKKLVKREINKMGLYGQELQAYAENLIKVDVGEDGELRLIYKNGPNVNIVKLNTPVENK